MAHRFAFAAHRSVRHIIFTLVVAAVAGGWLCTPETSASTFTVEPTQIFFSGTTNSVVVTLRNGSDGPLRFELTVFTWTQSAKGEMELAPTRDIVLFPSLLTLAPGESRRVRVGRIAEADIRERTYRVFVEELPPIDAAGGGVRVLTKMGIPIFLRPGKEVASVTLNGLSQRGGRLRFTIANQGTVHFIPKRVVVRGLTAAAEAFEMPLDSWYVLAGGRREFEVDLPKGGCDTLSSLVVSVEFESQILQERLQTPTGACSG